MEGEWDIKSRARFCARTGKPFAEGECFYTLLFRDGDRFRREDISEKAWNERNENIQPFSFWRSKYEAPEPPPAEPLRKEDAENLLRRLVSRGGPRIDECPVYSCINSGAKTDPASDRIE